MFKIYTRYLQYRRTLSYIYIYICVRWIPRFFFFLEFALSRVVSSCIVQIMIFRDVDWFGVAFTEAQEQQFKTLDLIWFDDDFNGFLMFSSLEAWFLDCYHPLFWKKSSTTPWFLATICLSYEKPQFPNYPWVMKHGNGLSWKNPWCVFSHHLFQKGHVFFHVFCWALWHLPALATAASGRPRSELCGEQVRCKTWIVEEMERTPGRRGRLLLKRCQSDAVEKSSIFSCDLKNGSTWGVSMAPIASNRWLIFEGKSQ